VRLALVFPSVGRGTVDWSHIPTGLAGGLRAAGHEPVPVPVDIPYALRRVADVLGLVRHRRRGLGAMTAPAVRARTAVAGRRLAAAPVDAIVLMGTTFEIPRSVPHVTYDDMTVPQFAVLTGLPPALERPWRARQERALRDAVACCAVSDWVAGSLIEDYGVDRARIEVAGLGANVPTAAEERDWSVPRFLFVGVEWERKGGPRLIRAFRRVRECLPAATLDVVGGAPALDEAGVAVHGRLDLRTEDGRAALQELYRRATCFVLPSRFEPFGIVHAEAGHAGVPSIGTTVGGAPTAIGPGGITVAPDDDGRLAEAMLELADPETAKRYGALAREHARQFTWENVARRIVARLDVEPGRRPAP
jgi:glycosyltransferase involved in cell wall biosynthesis